LNCLRPVKPVVWGLSGLEKEGVPAFEVAVEVGWLDRDENTESENPEPDAVADVGWLDNGVAVFPVLKLG